MTVGENIARQRKAAGLSTGALAGRVRVCENWVERCEEGDIQPSGIMLERLADALRVPVETLTQTEA